MWLMGWILNLEADTHGLAALDWCVGDRGGIDFDPPDSTFCEINFTYEFGI
jgi:hypothetical protein